MTATTTQEGEDEVQWEEKAKAELDTQIDRLYEKRASTREEAFAAVSTALRKRWLHEPLDGRWETLADIAVKSLRRGAPSEMKAAAEMAELLCVTLGREQRMFDVLAEPLLLAATTRTAPAEDNVAAPAAIRALTTAAAFCAVEDPRGAVSIAAGLNRAVLSAAPNARTPAAIAAAVASEALLAANFPTTAFVVATAAPAEVPGRPSSADSAAAAPQSTTMTSPLTTSSAALMSDTAQNGRLAARERLAPLLDHADLDVRVEAGFAIALLFDQSQEEEEEEEEEEESGAKKTLRDCPGWDRLEAKVEQLVAGAAMRAKRERAKEQPAFKLVGRALLDGQTPEERLTVRFQEVVFHGWARLIRLWHLRRVLATGLAVHLEESDVLAEAFDLRIDREAVRARRTRVEKRLERSPCSAASKGRSRELRKSRDSRAAFNAQSFSADD